MKKGCLFLFMMAWLLPFLGAFSSGNVETCDASLNPVLSHQGGFYATSFLLSIDSKPQTTVYYTLDGSIPTNESMRYTSPIVIEERSIPSSGDEYLITEDTIHIPTPISMIRTSPQYWISPKEAIFQATVLRVIAYDHSGQSHSEVITQSYFVHEDMDERYTFLVMSIVTDPKNLFDYQTGIHIMGKHYDQTIPESGHYNRTGNYFMSGDDWERPIHIELFESNGIHVMSQDAGLRIHGGLSRKYPIKSYRLYARKEYDDHNTFNYRFFEDESITSFKRLVLRNGGQAYQYSFFGEAFAQHILKPLQLDLQNSRPVILFINGEYFGIRNIRERLDTNYLYDHYGLDEKQVTILTGHAYMEDGTRTGQLHYQRLYQYATLNDLSNDHHYAKVQRWLDTDNYIDYMIAELYMGNVDWPQNNIFYWRKNTTYRPQAPYGHDGRWRFMINDLDASFGISWGTTTPDVNSFERLTGETWKTGKLLKNLLENETFKAQFAYRTIQLLETVFDKDRLTNELDQWVALYTPEMEEHIHRFGYPASMDTWLSYVNRMYVFAEGRKDVMMDTMETYLGLTKKHSVSITFDEHKGSLTILGKDDASGVSIDEYYDDLPITFYAKPDDGYHVNGWYYHGMLLSKDDTITLRPELALDLELRFEEGPTTPKPNDLTNMIYLGVSMMWSLTAIVVLLETIRRSKQA